jgi:hypothetical protein
MLPSSSSGGPRLCDVAAFFLVTALVARSASFILLASTLVGSSHGRDDSAGLHAGGWTVGAVAGVVLLSLGLTGTYQGLYCLCPPVAWQRVGIAPVISSLVVLLLAFAALVMGARRPHTRCLPAWLLPAFYR